MQKNKLRYLISSMLILVVMLVLGTVYIKWYKGFGSTIPFTILAPLLTLNIMRLFSKKEVQERFFLLFGALVMITSIVLFVVSLSPVSYPEANKIAIGEGLKELTPPPADVTMASELPLSKRIANCYLFTGNLDGTDVYFMVSPLDGSTQVEVVGDSYLDRAFELSGD